jgi:hypothetical protein
MIDIGITNGRGRRMPSALDSLTETSFTNIDLIMVCGALILLGCVGAVTGVALIL